METDAKTGSGVKQFSLTVREALKDQIARWREKGQVGRPVRAMIVGVPNVGKSTFINKVARKKSAKTSDRPGVTRGKQWVNVDSSLDLLDTPGILWPKFEDETTGMLLAFTGAVKDDVMDVETLGCPFMALLGERYPTALSAAYKLPEVPRREGEENDIAYGYRRRAGHGTDGAGATGRVPGRQARTLYTGGAPRCGSMKRRPAGLDGRGFAAVTRRGLGLWLARCTPRR